MASGCAQGARISTIAASRAAISAPLSASSRRATRCLSSSRMRPVASTPTSAVIRRVSSSSRIAASICRPVKRSARSRVSQELPRCSRSRSRARNPGRSPAAAALSWGARLSMRHCSGGAGRGAAAVWRTACARWREYAYGEKGRMVRVPRCKVRGVEAQHERPPGRARHRSAEPATRRARRAGARAADHRRRLARQEAALSAGRGHPPDARPGARDAVQLAGRARSGRALP